MYDRNGRYLYQPPVTSARRSLRNLLIAGYSVALFLALGAGLALAMGGQ